MLGSLGVSRQRTAKRKNLWCRIIHVNRMPCWFVSPCSLTFLRPVTPHRKSDASRRQPAVFSAVHIITGIRRCGKTFYLFQKIHDLSTKTASRVMIFSISTSLTIVCNQCKTPCSTILLLNTGGNIPTLVTMAATSSLTKCKNAPIGRDSASA